MVVASSWNLCEAVTNIISLALEWTSIASSTVSASMGSIFASGSATCSRFGDEKVTKGKMIGVALFLEGGVGATCVLHPARFGLS